MSMIGVGAQDEARKEGRVKDGEGKEGFHDRGNKRKNGVEKRLRPTRESREGPHHPFPQLELELDCATLSRVQRGCRLGAEIGSAVEGEEHDPVLPGINWILLAGWTTLAC